MALTQISTNGVKDGSLLNADINASAAIAKSKIETFVNNNADNRVITGSGTANTLNAESNVVIDSTGQVSIGGSTTAFDTTGSLNGLQGYYETDSGIATIGSYSSGGSTVLNFHTNSGGGASAERMRIDSSGNVGIGMTTVGAALDVNGASGDTLRLSNGSASAQYRIGRNSTDGKLEFFGTQSGDIAYTFGGVDGERMRLDSSGRLMLGTTTAVGSNTPNLQVKAVSPASGFDNHIYLEGNETSGAANTGGQIGFGGHDGNTARNWAAISGFKTNGNSGNTSSYLSFKTRRSGVNGVNEMWRMTAMGSLLARDNKESAVGREFTNGSVPAGQTRDHTDNSRLNFNSIGGNGGGHITCLSVSSQDQNPSGAMIIAGVHGQGFNTYNTILSSFDSGISVTFSGGTVSIQNTSSETIYYSVNVIHMGTGNTTYLGR